MPDPSIPDPNLEERLQFLFKSTESLHSNMQLMYEQMQTMHKQMVADRTLQESRLDKILNILDRVSDLMKYRYKRPERFEGPPSKN